MNQQFQPGQIVQFNWNAPKYGVDTKYGRVEGVHFYADAFGKPQEVLTLRKMVLADHCEHSGVMEYKPTAVMVHMVPAFDVHLADE